MSQRLFFLIVALLLITGCDIVDDRIGDREPNTATPQAFSTATPGGRISVWMVAPTGQAAGTPAPNVTEVGALVGPAATGTAAFERSFAATQTAAAPTPQPAFQPDDCPLPSGLNAPTRPDNFVDFPATIGVYLSNGGAPSILESTLRTWNAITVQGGLVQADTDLTGDKIPEIVVSIFNPYTYNAEAVLNAGRMMIYGCDNFGYRLLYLTPDNPGLALPVLHRVGDMNADTKAELVFDLQSCTTTYCSREGFMLTWNPVVGVFEMLNNGQILSTNGRIGVVDLEGDGILEMTVSSSLPTSASTGPTRGAIDVWDWNGLNYVLAQRLTDESRYRIHVIHDADGEFLAGNVREAVRLYQEARDNDELLSWTNPSELSILTAYINYRLVTANVRLGNNGRAEQSLSTLLAENPEGSPGAGYAAMGQAFMDAVRRGEGNTAGCQLALTIAAARPETISYLNSYGSANRTYQLNDLCSF